VRPYASESPSWRISQYSDGRTGKLRTMSQGSELTSPSPILAYLVEQLALYLPEASKKTLGVYDDAIARTTHHGDLHRAWQCAGWAVDLAERSGQSHVGRMAHELKEVHKLWKDSWFGAEFGILGKLGHGVGPGEDIEIQWVDDSVAIAKAVSETSGWDSVPWQELLTSLLDVEPKL
jgi:hypothetical protein